MRVISSYKKVEQAIEMLRRVYEIENRIPEDIAKAVNDAVSGSYKGARLKFYSMLLEDTELYTAFRKALKGNLKMG